MLYGVLFLLFVFASYLAFRFPFKSLIVAVFFAPWTGLSVDAGLGVSAYLIFLVPLFAASVLSALNGSRAREAFAASGYLWWVFFFSIIWSCVQMFVLPESKIAGGIFRSPAVRALTQLFMFFLTISPLFIIPWLARTANKLLKMLMTYLLSVILLAILGWAQLIVWSLTGSDPLPVGLFNNLVSDSFQVRSGAFVFDGAVVIRMSSFGGEPKGLGIGIALGLLLVQAGYNFKKKWGVFVWPFLFISMIATFSTMALMSWFAASVLQILFVNLKRNNLSIVPRSVKVSRAFFFVVIVVIIPVSFIVFPDASFVRIIEFRTTDRIFGSSTNPLGASGYLEDFNLAVLGFLSDSPLMSLVGVGIGNAHLYADPFLPDSASQYASGTPFVAKSAMLKWISEIGLITFIVFLLWWFQLLKRVLSKLGSRENILLSGEFIKSFGFSLLAVWTVSAYITPQFFLFTGMLLAMKLSARGDTIRGGAVAAI